MNRITRCPSCDTLFKVVPDQLRLSQGWVRCGSCGTVFDAGAQMQHSEAHAPAGADPADPDAVPSAWALLLDEDERQLLEGAEDPVKNNEYGAVSDDKSLDSGEYSDNEFDSFESTRVVLTDASFAPSEPDPESVAEAQKALDALESGQVDFLISQLEGAASADAAPSASQPEREAHARDIASHLLRRRRADAPAHDADKAANKDADEAEKEMPALVRASADSSALAPLVQAAPAAHVEKPAVPAEPRAKPSRSAGASKSAKSSRSSKSSRSTQGKRSSKKPASAPEDELPSFMRDARRGNPWLRAGVVLAVVVALVFAGGYWVHEKRDWLAAAHPKVRPTLKAFCRVLGCQIRPLRMLEGVALEGSSFNRLSDGQFRLNLSLRNTQPLELATPSLELSLTDAQDQVVFKRVVHPHDLQAPAVLMPRRDWSGGFTLGLDPQLSSQVAGYRVLAFYP